VLCQTSLTGKTKTMVRSRHKHEHLILPMCADVPA
jgi:hypothetical protein